MQMKDFHTSSNAICSSPLKVEMFADHLLVILIAFAFHIRSFDQDTVPSTHRPSFPSKQRMTFLNYCRNRTLNNFVTSHEIFVVTIVFFPIFVPIRSFYRGENRVCTSVHVN